MNFKTYIQLLTNILKTRHKAQEEAHNMEGVVQLIKLNHLQSLTEAIEKNPTILYSLYKKKSLMSWCKFYKNTKALMVITQMNEKYAFPKKNYQIAA